ncbi:MBL fold metallo-hydrolase [Paenibacillus chitinolyticus]|uniref:MBL fold metallo-hydrolase n=1 Tax=Paenibacillus chitinolyticus TaxID=79263 RepID=UPI0036D8C679
MKITRESDLYQLAFLPRMFPVNCYLVEEKDGLTLIDAAMPFSVKGIMKAAGGIGKPIKRIVLTHAHEDHIGALDELKRLLPQAEVLISARDARLLKGDATLDPGEPQTPVRGAVPKKVTTVPDVLLKEGDRIGSLLALSTPGHTPGSMSFLDVRSNAVIAGDALQLRGGIAVAGQVKLLFPFPALATWNKSEALDSVKKLRDYSPSLLAVGHGTMLQNPAAQLDLAIAAAERNLAASLNGRSSH